MKATKYSQYLQKREHLQYVDTPHWIYIFEALIYAAFFIIVGVWISTFLLTSSLIQGTVGNMGIGGFILTILYYVALVVKWGLIIYGLGFFIHRVIYYLTTYVFASERRLYVKTGLIMARVDSVNFDEIRSIEVNYGFIGRFLGYGKLNMDARFVQDTEIPFVYYPERFVKLINHENDLVKDVNLSFATQGMNDPEQIRQMLKSEQGIPSNERQQKIIEHYENLARQKKEQRAQDADFIEHDFEDAVLDDGEDESGKKLKNDHGSNHPQPQTSTDFLNN